MKKDLGDIIYKHRLDIDLTQDQYGATYNVSGPAIFKFEKGYVRPSFVRPLNLTKDSEVVRAKLLLELQDPRRPKSITYVRKQLAARGLKGITKKELSCARTSRKKARKSIQEWNRILKRIRANQKELDKAIKKMKKGTS